MLSLTLSFFFWRSFVWLLPSVARTITGTGSVRLRSHKGSSAGLDEVVFEADVFSVFTVAVSRCLTRKRCERTYSVSGSDVRNRGRFAESSL